MAGIVWTVFVLHFLVVIAKTTYLSRAEYPRKIEYKAWEDLFGLLVSIGLVVWAGYWLFLV